MYSLTRKLLYITLQMGVCYIFRAYQGKAKKGEFFIREAGWRVASSIFSVFDFLFLISCPHHFGKLSRIHFNVNRLSSSTLAKSLKRCRRRKIMQKSGNFCSEVKVVHNCTLSKVVHVVKGQWQINMCRNMAA